MRLANSTTSKWHAKTFGKMEYSEFAATFQTECQKWNPYEWTALFRRLHAGYVVLTTKHHEGYLLWNSKQQIVNQRNVFVGRDIVSELAAALRETEISAQ